VREERFETAPDQNCDPQIDERSSYGDNSPSHSSSNLALNLLRDKSSGMAGRKYGKNSNSRSRELECSTCPPFCSPVDFPIALKKPLQYSRYRALFGRKGSSAIAANRSTIDERNCWRGVACSSRGGVDRKGKLSRALQATPLQRFCFSERHCRKIARGMTTPRLSSLM
jgi:hypothetical protein